MTINLIMITQTKNKKGQILIMKFDETLSRAVIRTLKTNKVAMLLGEPGIGKSSWLRELAKKLNTAIFVVNCNQLAEKADLTGARLMPDETTNRYSQHFFPHTDIDSAIVYAESHPEEQPILFLDEINRTTSDVTAAAMSISTDRKIGTVELPANLRIVVAGNDKGNITPLDSAQISRFTLYRVEPEIETYFKVNPHLNKFIKNVLLAHPSYTFCKPIDGDIVASNDDDNNDEQAMLIDDIFDDGDNMLQFTTPRTITALSEWLDGFTDSELFEFAMDVNEQIVNGETRNVSILCEIIEGHVGHTLFSKCLLDEIVATLSNVKNTVKVTVPPRYAEMKTQPDVTSLSAFFGTLSDKEKAEMMIYMLTEKNVDNSRYIQGLAPVMTSISTETFNDLLELNNNDMLDDDNVNALSSTKTQFAVMVKNFIAA